MRGEGAAPQDWDVEVSLPAGQLGLEVKVRPLECSATVVLV